jgi:hypothetical protein
VPHVVNALAAVTALAVHSVTIASVVMKSVSLVSFVRSAVSVLSVQYVAAMRVITTAAILILMLKSAMIRAVVVAINAVIAAT